MLPLDQQRKGGLARVASVRQLLLQENPQTFTILAGDFLSPSALSHSKVNGTTLNGKQMIASFNTLGVDFVTFGNHEFDLTQSDLISRMNESTFKWISSNVFQTGTNQSFSISIPYHILNIDQIRILFIGLTIDKNQSYVQIVNKTSLIPFVKQFLQSLSNIKYDVLIALTHLDLSTDIELADNIPQIDLILGGHEHEDYYLLRGSKWTPITKADANAFTVYIHRCAFNLNTKQFRVYSTLSKITSELSDEPKTNEVLNYWFNLGMKAFEDEGYKPNKTVSCLPSNIELDGRSSSVRSSQTLLSKYCSDCMIDSTSSSGTTVGLFDSGSIRIDDILRGTITQMMFYVYYHIEIIYLLFLFLVKS
jgi:5'-nucleotidase